MYLQESKNSSRHISSIDLGILIVLEVNFKNKRVNSLTHKRKII